MAELAKRFRGTCSTHGLIIETDDIEEGQAAVEAHKAEHDRAYKANQLALALAAPNPEGALRFFGFIEENNDA